MHQLTTKHKQSRTAFYWSSTLRSNFSTQYCRILEWNSPRVLAKGDFLEVASVSCFFASSVIDDNVWVGTLVNLNFWNHIYNSTSLKTFDCTLIVKYTLVSCYHGKQKTSIVSTEESLEVTWYEGLLMTFMNYVCKGSRCVKQQKNFLERSYVRFFSKA